MSLFKKLIFKRLIIRLSWFKSKLLGFISRKDFKNIKEFCLFVGYPRSGHSLIASLLDAHPDIIIGMEWGVLLFLQQGFKKRQIFYSLAHNSELYTKKYKNIWTGYSYHVPLEWQGKYRNLMLIGDKLGGRTSLILQESSDQLKKLEHVLQIKPKLIHVIRNPFDIITTCTIRSLENRIILSKPTSLDLLPFIRSFFNRANVIARLKNENEYDMIDIYHEEFISDPRKGLRSLMDFFELEADESYYNNCLSIVYNEVKKSRYSIEWTDELKKFVEKEIKKYSFLQHYNYSN